MKKEALRYLLLAGVLCPMVFFGTFLTLGFLVDGYDPAKDLVSELGAFGSPVQGIANFGGFILTGALLILFAIGLLAVIGTDMPGKAVSLFVSLVGISVIAIGFFPCDPGCTSSFPHGMIHNFLITLPGVLGFTALFFFTLHKKALFRFNRSWIYGFSILAPLVALILFFGHAYYNTEQIGLIQRLLLAVPLVSLAGASLYLFQKGSKN